MKLQVICPRCGRESSLDASLVNRKLRCKGCALVFQISEASTDPDVSRERRGSAGQTTQGAGRARGRAQAKPAAELDAPADTSWLDEGADGEEVVQPASMAPRRTRSASALGPKPENEGISPNLVVGLVVGAALVTLVLALIVAKGGRNSATETKGELADKQLQAAPGVFERLTKAVSSLGPESANNAADYPDLGPLPPQLLPPPPLRDLSAHEQQNRFFISQCDRLANILATVHDGPSLKSAGEQIKSQQNQFVEELRRSTPLFRLTPAEEAEVIRRISDEWRKSMARFRQESERISRLPGLASLAGVQFSALIDQISAPVERAIERAENFQAPTSGPPPYADVHLQVQKGDEAGFYYQKLNEQREGLHNSGIYGTMGVDYGEAVRVSYRFWPVYDIDEFARNLPFSKSVVKGNQVFVEGGPVPAAELAAVKKIKEAREAASREEARNRESQAGADDPQPPAVADELTKALFALRSSQGHKRSEGIRQINQMTPEDDRRDEVQKQLATLLTGPDGFFIGDVMKAMVLWRTDDTAPALIKMLNSPEIVVRWTAEELLGELGDPRAAKPLAARIQKDGNKVKPALRALGPAAEPALIPLLRDPNSNVRAQACEILKEVGGKEALETMLSLPADPDFGVQIAAREAMQAIRFRVGPIEIPKKNTATKGKSGKPR